MESGNETGKVAVRDARPLSQNVPVPRYTHGCRMSASLNVSHAAQELFAEHGAAVYRLAVALLRHPQDAEDVVQETFVKLLRHLGAGGNTENIRGWLFTVAVHALRDRQRWRARWIPWGPAHDGVAAPPRLLDEDGRLEVLRHALQRLQPRDRLLLALRAQGLGYREIAAAAGIRFSSVGRLLARAIARCERACADRRAAGSPRTIKPERHGLL
jgi:RNA polymerase sigma-70 factor (ECF subfamily)